MYLGKQIKKQHGHGQEKYYLVLIITIINYYHCNYVVY